MGDFLKWLQFALTILPVILQVVQQVEIVIGPGQGTVKKALVMSAIQSVPNVVPGDTALASAIVSNLVDKTVNAINSSAVSKATVAK